MNTPDEERALVLFDADCGFCRWSAGVIENWDRRGRTRGLTIQSATGQNLLEDLDPEERMDSWHLALPDGNVYSAGAAAAPLLRLLPGGSPLAWLAERSPRLTENAYRFIANRRSFFGRVLRRLGRIPPPAA